MTRNFLPQFALMLVAASMAALAWTASGRQTPNLNQEFVSDNTALDRLFDLGTAFSSDAFAQKSNPPVLLLTPAMMPTVNCPGNITVNLGPGECTAPVSYSVSCTGGSPTGTAGTVSHPIDFNNGNDGIMFDVRNLSAEPMTISEFGPSLDAGNWTMEVYYTAATWQGNETNPAAWIFAGAQNVTSVTPNAGTAVPGFGIVIPPFTTLGIYLTATSGAPLNYTGIGAGISRQYDDGMLRVSSNPGAGKSYYFGTTLQNRAYNGYVKYVTAAPKQLAGLHSGAEFPVGVTTNIFQCTDGMGMTATCSFTVTVVSFPGNNNGLVCNDLVNVALGPDCTKTLGADDVLEGGPYRCYDSYQVQVDRIPPMGNGPWAPAVFTSADIDKVYALRVFDPQTNNYCESSVAIMDNLPPVLDCTPNPAIVPCNFNLAPTNFVTTELIQKYSAAGLPLTVLDNQTVELSIPVSAAAGATVNDLDFRTRVNGDPFEANLEIDVISPSGTLVRVWDQLIGCSGQPLFVRFDDENAVPFSCPAYTGDQRARIPLGIDLLSDFDGEPANGVWKIRYRDVNGGGDACSIVLAELFVKYTATFNTGFPNGLKYPQNVTQLSANSFRVPAPLLDPCSDVTLSFTDQTLPQNCASGLTAIVNRTWTARDKSNNIASCVQPIHLVRPTIDDVLLPPNYDDIQEPAFSCNDEYPTPEWVESHGGQGFPYVYGQPTGCSINWTHTDLKIKNCDGSYTVSRQWAILDFCSSQTFVHTQIIQVKDVVAPYFECPADMTVSTNLYSCCATPNLPDIVISDGCSRIKQIRAYVVTFEPYFHDTIAVYALPGALSTFPGNNLNNPDTLGIFGSTPCLPIGEHEVVYEVIDDCGNVGACVFDLVVKDYTTPVATCQQFTTVAIGPDDPYDCYEPGPEGCTFAGVTKVPAGSFDSGSYDNCGNIKLTIRRAQPYSDCILALNDENGAPPCNDNYPDDVTEYDIATQESDSIKFYCCEVGTVQMVILRAYQLDYDGSISIGPDGEEIFNECVIQVEVQDKLKPGCQSPANVTVSCENFDPSLWAYGIPDVEDNCCLDTTRMFMGQKGLTHSVNYTQFDTVCNRGTITRTFRVWDCHGLTSQCTQKIYVNYEQDFFIKFPDDKVIYFCDSSGVYDTPQFYGKDCELLGVTYQDEIFTVVPDACYKIERTWRIINWCTYDPNQNCVLVPNPNPNAVSNHANNLPGPIVSALGTPQPWAPTNVKISPNDLLPTNYSAYYNPNINCYEYRQIIKIIDTQDPIVENCPASPVEICDLSDNDPLLWNESYWYDATHDMHDLCEGAADLSITATDACSDANIDIRYLLFLDLDNSGDMETVISSTNPPPPNTVYFGNANSPDFLGGTARAFDERPVANAQKYRFAIETKVTGDKKTAYLRWNTQAQPNAFVVPQLPYGTHKIKWIVEDGCGNETVCEYAFIIKDCKAPNVLCYNGLSVNIMPTGMIAVFYNDFLQWGIDNCTPASQLVYGIRRAGTGQGFPVDNNGNPITSVAFTCDDVGTQPVELWAMDAAGNAAYCETYIIVQDPFGNCTPNTHSTVAGALQTENFDGVEETQVELYGTSPGLPDVHQFGTTDASGAFMFASAVPMAANYTLTPTKDDNPMNGVSTFDLVLMSKHIIGLTPLESPYKIIAADVNRSNSVTTFDIVELRKLILGIYTELPNNTSWRFIDRSFQFTDAANPFASAPFAENKSIANVQDDQMHDDFVGIKIGDLTGDATANANMSAQQRAAGTLLIEVEDRDVAEGETFAVTFNAAQASQGLQFTLNTNGLQVVDVVANDRVDASHFGVFDDLVSGETRALTASIDGADEFTLVFRATSAGRLSRMLQLSSRITRTEAYDLYGNLLDVALRFTGQPAAGVGFELYQNQPNPWVHRTQIGFHLPEAAPALLTVFDETGRVVYTEKGDFPRGYNVFQLQQRLLNSAAGALHYRVESGPYSATRTMVQTR